MQLADNPFDSAAYGLRIARLTTSPADDATALAACLTDARTAGYAMAVIRLAADEPLVDAIARSGRAPVDRLVTSTLTRRPAPPHRASDIAIEQRARIDAPADVDAIVAITTRSMTSSRFHADARLSPEGTRALFAAWVRNDVTGRAQHVIVARAGGDVVGYVAVLASEHHAAIDLIAVADSHQNRGVGAAMLDAFIAWIGERDVVATVGTQDTNPALRLYARAGFEPTSTHVTYHLWLDEDAS